MHSSNTFTIVLLGALLVASGNAISADNSHVPAVGTLVTAVQNNVPATQESPGLAQRAKKQEKLEKIRKERAEKEAGKPEQPVKPVPVPPKKPPLPVPPKKPPVPVPPKKPPVPVPPQKPPVPVPPQKPPVPLPPQKPPVPLPPQKPPVPVPPQKPPVPVPPQKPPVPVPPQKPPVPVPPAGQTSILPKYQFKEFTTATGPNAYCSRTTNSTAKFGRVHFAQTHLLETSHPFFVLSGNRDTLIRVSVSGSGAAPAVRVQGRRNGSELGTICLTGPSVLPASVNENNPDRANSFVGTVPAAWLVPGLNLMITAGAATKVIAASDLKVGPSPELTVVSVNWQLFSDTEIDPYPDSYKAEFAAKMPVTKVRYAEFPAKVAIPKLPISPLERGQSRNGPETPQPALIADGQQRCTDTDKAAATCTPWGGASVNFALIDLTGELQRANGLENLSFWYGDTSKNRKLGGGLGGGNVGAGDGYSGVFNHEAGHAFDMPHWGDGLYSRVSASDPQKFPYTGQYNNGAGGGFGNSWAFDAIDGTFVNPVCAASGKERQDPMQRVGDYACTDLPNRVYDHFSDYSAMYLHRFFTGAASVYAGQVDSPRDATNNFRPPFSFPTKTGRPNLIFGTTGTDPKIMRWDALSLTYTELTPATIGPDPRVFGERYPLQWNVPVYTLWGGFSTTTPSATMILDPLHYRGNAKRVWDPTNPLDFAVLKTFNSGEGYYWGADLVAKAEFKDGSVKYALVKRTARGTNPLKRDSYTYWSVNIPVSEGASLKKVSLYHRPMESRTSDNGNVNSENYRISNLNSTQNANLTAAHYLDTARLVATREFN